MKSPRKVVLIGLDGANPELFKMYADQGELPHIARLMKQGVFAVALPSVPANTPVNWTTIATGAHPGTHGITDFWIHFPGDPLDKFDEVFRSEFVTAEQIWNTADQTGRRAIVMNYPCAYPPAMKHGIFVGGEGSPDAGSVFELKSSCCFVSEKAAQGTRGATLVHFTPAEGNLQTRIALIPDKGANSQGVEYELRLRASSSGFSWLEVRDEKGQARASLHPQEWSEWLVERFMVDGRERKGWFRFYLSELSPDGERFKLYTSQIFPEDGYTVPDETGKELVKKIGPFLEYCGAGPFRRGWHDARAWFDEMRYQGRWIARAGSYLINEYDGHLFYSHFHMLDHVFHYLWGGFDPLTGWYDPAHSHEYEAWMLEAHKICDEMVSIFMDEAGEDTILIVISDHGLIPHIKAVSINNLLAREGLISCQPGPHNKPIVDWGKTLAYKPTDAVHIWINSKGRDPQGIVDPADYERVQEKIIDVLLNLRDPENGKRPVALALKKRDAALFGLWGDRVGDVIFFMNDEYSAPLSSPLSNDGRVIVRMGPEEEGQENFHSPDYQAYHGCTLPSNAIGRGGSEAGMFLIWGPGIRQGIRKDHPIRLLDVAPTIAYLMGIPQPAQAEGRILFELLR